MVDINLVMPKYETPPLKEKRIPLGISYLTAALKQEGYSVKCQDLIFEPLDLNCKYLGVTVPTVCFYGAAKIVKQAKERGIFTIAGGPHASVDPESLLKIGFDAVVVGDGEIALPQIIEKLEKGVGVQGIINGCVEDLDNLPFPDLEWTKKHDFLKSGQGMPVIPVLTSRGCPFNCTFCLHVFGRKIRTRSAENLIAEISNYRGAFIEICDDAFTINRKRTLEFAKLMRKERVDIAGFAISNGVRVDCVDRKIIRNLKEAGMKNVMYGLESADNSVLKAIRKDITRDLAEKAIKITKKAGIKPGIFMMIGLPTSTLKSDLDSIKWIKKQDVFSSWGVTVPYPNTELFEWVEKNGKWLANPKNYYLYSPEAKRPLSFFETPDYTLKEREKALGEAINVYKVR